MIDELSRKRIAKLTDKAIAHLGEQNYQAALEVSDELAREKGPLAFYFAGQAYAGMKNFRAAVASMKTGVLRRPEFWCNWFLLGVYLSNLDKNEKALAAYRQALLCPQVDADLVSLNIAILSLKCREYETALTVLAGIENDSMRWGVESTRVLAVEGTGRFAEAAGLAESFLEERPEGDEEYGKTVGRVAAALARIRLRQGKSREEVRGFLLQCLADYGCSSEVLREITALDPLRYSKEAKYFRLVVEIGLPPSHPWYRQAPVHFVIYDVISDTEDEALELIRGFEIPTGYESLKVIECKIQEERPEDPMGVYWITERFFPGM